MARTSEPESSRESRRASCGTRPGRIGFKALFTLVLGILAVVLAIISIGDSIFHWSRGTRLAVTDKEELYYKGVSTEDAERFGRTLKEIGYFNGTSAKTVQLTKNNDLFVFNFVVKDGSWDDAESVEGMRVIALQIAARMLDGLPVELQLSDKNMSLRKSLVLDKDSLGKRLAVSGTEEIFYRGVKDEEAKKLGELLQKMNYFDGKSAGTVALVRDDGKVRVTFLIIEGLWDDDRVVKEFTAKGRQIKTELFGTEPVEVCLADGMFRVKKTVAVP